jgi:hypothetical protein
MDADKGGGEKKNHPPIEFRFFHPPFPIHGTTRPPPFHEEERIENPFGIICYTIILSNSKGGVFHDAGKKL